MIQSIDLFRLGKNFLYSKERRVSENMMWYVDYHTSILKLQKVK